jgi:hypothetical protein
MPATSGRTCTSPNDLQAWLDQQEREILVSALRESRFNRTATAAPGPEPAPDPLPHCAVGHLRPATTP